MWDHCYRAADEKLSNFHCDHLCRLETHGLVQTALCRLEAHGLVQITLCRLPNETKGAVETCFKTSYADEIHCYAVEKPFLNADESKLYANSTISITKSNGCADKQLPRRSMHCCAWH
ncbi:hypothetical protein Droror1_Dr00004231 [Drosera rotundifolia]